MASHIADGFNYPRETKRLGGCWTLRDVPDSNPFTRGAGKANNAPTHATNRTDDIDGAAPCTTSGFRVQKYTKKPDFSMTAGDIEKASPTRLIPENVNRANDRVVNNRDIPHSFPESKLFTTPRVVDPLSPQYPLPQVRHRVSTPPRQLRETNKIADIPGTKAVPKLSRAVARNPLDYSDLPLSQAGSSTLARKRTSPSMAMETADICKPTNHDVFRSNRRTNPLSPEYTLPAPKGAPSGADFSIGAVPGSTSRKPPLTRADRPLLSLQSKDIEGASPQNHVPYPKNRRQWKTTCDVSDILSKS